MATPSLDQIIANIQPLDRHVEIKAQEHTAQLVMPPRALGQLHNTAEKLCGICGELTPVIDNKAVIIMAGDHGVAASGVSAFPQEVTGAMIQTFLAGGAGINAIARYVNASVHVVDMGAIPTIDPSKMPNADNFIDRKIAPGTANFIEGPAMTMDQAENAVIRGFECAASAFENGVDLLATGDMGIGNTTPSAAIGMVVTGADADSMVGRGTGVDDEGLKNKKAAIQKGIDVNLPDPSNGLDILAKVGGFEIGGIAGMILAAAYHRKPVVVDGFISTAGALIAHTLCPAAIDYMFAGHRSEEPGHIVMLKHLGLSPLIQLGLRLGEGTGAALAMNIMEASLSVFKEVMTFEEAGIPTE